MGRKSKQLTQDEELQKIRTRFKVAYDLDDENRNRAIEDVDFRDGDQWDEAAKREREEDGRPCLTFNRLEGFVDQVAGDARQTKNSIRMRPFDESQNATILENLIEQIEYKSKADIAYSTAVDHSAGHGFGYIGVNTRYLPKSFDQECYIYRIRDAFSVLFGPCEEPTGYDADYVFRHYIMDKDEFEAKYPGKSTGQTPMMKGEGYENWYKDKGVRVAEYFEKRKGTSTLYLLDDGTVITDKKELPEGREIINEREDEEDVKIYRSLLCGDEYLEEPKLFPGIYLPIVRVIGKELVVKGKSIFRGVFRHAKDAQKSYNYFRTTSAETVGLAPRVPWLVTPEQIEGFEGIWSTANRKNHAYLPYNQQPGHSQPSRVDPTDINTGAIQESAMALDDIKGTTGIYDASLGASGNETSGKAILARQREGDTSTYHYHDNLSIAIEQVGRVLERMIPEVYDTERQMLVRQDDKEYQITVNQTQPDGSVLFDLTKGRYEAIVSTGPSYATQRIEAQDAMMQLVQVSPEIRQVAMDKVFETFDFAGAEEIARRLKAVIPPHILDPNAPPPPPTPEQQADMAKAEADIAEAEADKAEASVKMKEMEGQIMQTQESIMKLVEAVVAGEMHQHFAVHHREQ